MPASGRTIRLFVSSTFSDMKAERDVLQREVFPRLKQLCLPEGLRFQAIDLRWGISEEASRDNRTMRICLRELKRCQSGGPKPNFLILLGDRYGWRPLPETIPAELFERLETSLTAESAKNAEQSQDRGTTTDHTDGHGSTEPSSVNISASSGIVGLLRTWYRRDDNSVLPQYVLQPRRGVVEDNVVWSKQVEQPLLAALERSAASLRADPTLTPDQCVTLEETAIGFSATEQEIVHGALRVDEAADHVHAFARMVANLPEVPPPDFVDILPDGTRDTQASSRMASLKDRIEAKIGKDNFHRYTASWSEGAIAAESLKNLCDEIYIALKGVIEKQIAQLKGRSASEQEEYAQRAFGEERCHGFIGRADLLQKIEEYIKNDSRMPLIVSGPAGSGKSAFMAEAARRGRAAISENAVLARFIGATTGSSDILSLLRDVVRAIRKRYPAPPPKEGEQSKDGDIPVEIQPLTGAFHEALGGATAEHPLILFLDALDQLASANSARDLLWLPTNLPEHVRCVVSYALPAANLDPSTAAAASDPRVQVRDSLRQRLGDSPRLVLPPLSSAEGGALLAQWLDINGRTLQPTQSSEVLTSFAVEGNPLWLRVAVSECSNLPAWALPPRFPSTTAGLLRQVLEGLSAEHGAVLVERALGYLACARHGLAEDEVIDVLSADEEIMEDFRRRSPTERLKSEAERVRTLPVAVWVRFHGEIAPYLAERDMQGAALFGFYHRSFLEAIEAKCLPDGKRRLDAHRHLAEYFGKREWFLAPASVDSGVPPRRARIDDPPNVRKSSELPWHLFRLAELSDPRHTNLETWQGLIAILCDLLFVEAKARSRLVHELQEDYRLALAALPDTQARSASESRLRHRMDTWAGELQAYARHWSERRERIAHGESATGPEPQRPEVPGSSPNALESPDVNGGRTAPILTFAQFVRVSAAVLDEFGAIPGFCTQHAFNSMNDGAVARAAAAAVANPDHRVPVLLRAQASRRPFDTNSALIRSIHAHEPISALALSADGTRIVTGDQRGSVRIWDVETGECLQTVPMTSRYYHLAALAIDAEARIGVTVGDATDRLIRVWDLRAGVEAPASPLIGHDQGDKSVSMTPDGALLASGCADKTVRLWNVATGSCLRVFPNDKAVAAVHLSADGRSVTALVDNEGIVWDAETGHVVCRTSLGRSYRLAVSFDGTLAVFVEGQRMVVWNRTSATTQPLYEAPAQTYIDAVAITPDGALAACGSRDRTVRLFDLRSGKELRTFRGHSQGVAAVSIRADGRLLVSSGQDGIVRAWDAASASTAAIAAELQGKVNALAIARAQKVALCQREDGKIRFYLLESGEDMTLFAPPTSWAIDGTGRFCFSRQAQGVRAWDMSTGRTHEFVADEIPQTAEARHPILSLMTLRIAAAGNHAISAGPGRVWVWDLRTGRCTGALPVPAELRAMAISADGRFAAGASSSNDKDSDCGVRLWELGTGRLLHTFPHEASVNALSFSPDCRALLTGDSSGIMRAWHPVSGQLLQTIGEKQSFIRKNRSLGDILDLRVLPHGRMALALHSTNLHVCDLREGAAAEPLETGVNSSDALAVEVTEDARYALTGVAGSVLRAWDVEANRCVLASAEPVEIVRLNTAGDRVVIVSVDGDALFASMRNLDRGPAIVTALADDPQACPLCSAVLPTPAQVRQRISDYERAAGARSCPSLDLPAAAWEDVQLSSQCDHCGQPLRFNPFFAASAPNPDRIF